ncbi:MAG TPA: glycosyltransferase family 9 protein [Candidatus Binatia bacterium]|nr:glycosyltransferase family 9 protein [Candidatus Binatia bacterium]
MSRVSTPLGEPTPIAAASSLVIHPGALGDVLLAVPALRVLRARHPGDRLALAAQPRVGRLLAALGLVDESRAFEGLGLEALFVDDGALPHVPALESAARVVCWFGSRDPVFVSRLRALAPGAVIASASGDLGRPVWRHLLATLGETGPGDADDDVPSPDDPGSGCAGSRRGGADDSSGGWAGSRRAGQDLRAPIAVPSALVARGEALLREAGWDGRTPLAVLHVGAGGAAKRWPAEAFARVVERLTVRSAFAVAVHEGPADAEAVLAFRRRLPGAIALRHLPLPELAGALRHASVFLGNDSGVSHLAAGVGTGSVVLFTTENVPWRPWASQARVVVVSPPAVREADIEAVVDAVEAHLVGL